MQSSEICQDAPGHLTVSTVAAGSAAPFAGTDASAASKAKRILVVEDGGTLRRLLRHWLTRRGYDVAEAEDGIAALKRLQSESFDLITLDVDMPVMDGFEVCSRLREWEARRGGRSTPVVFVTGHDNLADRERGFAAGAADFLCKPMQEADFIVRIERLLAPNQQLCGLRALVVDDSPQTRKLVALNLNQYGIETIEAADGHEAFRLLEQQPGRIDLVVTDYVMPGMDGLELCRRVRKTLGLPWLPILLLSATTDREKVLQFFSAGATDYLCKPFTQEELVARIGVHMEIRRLSREHARQIAELERLNELKTNFLAIASHDLRSPLNGIIGSATVLQQAPELSPESRDMANTCANCGELLLDIINDVLALAKIEAQNSQAEFVSLDISTLVQQAGAAVRSVADAKAIRLMLPTAAGNLLVAGHATDLVRLFTNLISNAIKFSHRGSAVTITIEPAAPNQVRVAVSDQGIGIPPEKLPQLFDRFSKLSRPGTEGEASTGLGMAIVKEIVERHGGRIGAESAIGRGTTILIHLPRHQEPS